MPAGAGPGGRSGPRSGPRPASPWPWSSARRRGCRPGSATLRAARCRGRYSGPSARRPRPIRGGTRTAAGRPSRMPRAVCRRPAPPRAARGRSRPARSGRGNRRGGRSSGAQWGTPGMDRRPVLAVLALGVLLRPAPVAAQAWNSDAALALARRAVLRRGGAVADSSLHDYKAQAHGFLFFLGAFGQGLADPPRLVKADQLELEVYWKAPASSKQRVIGWRDQTQLPTDINYHRDHLGIIQNNFGAAMRLGEGDEVRDVPHPLSPAGPTIYDFALGDTTTIMLPEREVRVVTLRVRPKDFGLPRIVGTLYLDAETADLVRMAFNFTPRSYLDAELEDVSIVLDNALWERRYWLPYRQEIEIRRRATWLDVPVRGIIRARWEIDGYVLNLGLANSWFAGDEITFLPKAERDSFPWKEPLGAALQDIAEPVRQNDLARVRAEVEQIAGRRILTGLKGRRLGVRGVSDLLHANRVEGLAAGAGVVVRGGGERREPRGRVSYGFGDQRAKGALSAVDRRGRSALDISVYREVRDVGATYLRLSGAGHVLFPLGATRLLARAQGGIATADLPAHRAFVLGGRGTLLGDEFRRWGGGRVGLLHLEWRVPVPFVSLGVGPYARTPRTLTVAPYVAFGWAAAPVAGTPWMATPGTRITIGLAFEWLGVFRWEAGYGTATHRLGLAFDV